MKRTYPTNVDGQIFYIDEDAFSLLQNYLHQLKVTFKGTEGEEIVGDIESRIRELFNEKLEAGAGVIVLADVERVIETMGRPEDLSEDEPVQECEEAETKSESSDTKQTSSSSSENAKEKNYTAMFSFSLPRNKRLYRNMKNKVFGGVIGGLAVYLGWNANIMRVLFLILAHSTKLLPLTIIYLIAWMVIPPALTPRQILQMKGEPINVDTVGHTVMTESPVTPPPINENANFITTCFSVAAKVVLGFIGLLSGVIAMGSLISFLFLLCSGLAFWSFGYTDLLDVLNVFELGAIFYALFVVASLLGVVLFGSIAWGCAASIFSLPRMSKAASITLTIISIMLIALVAVIAIVAAAM